MTDPAFSSRSDCPIPYIPDIEPDLIQDCEIPPVPDPFWQAPIFPPIIPPIVVGCPPISISASATMVMNKDSSLKFSASASTYDPNGDECFPFLDLDIWVPFACPEMSVSPSPSPQVAGSPSVKFEIEKSKDDAPDCQYEFDLEITFVCTSMEITLQDIYEIDFLDPPEMDVVATNDWSENECVIEFDIEIGIPTLDEVDADCAENDEVLIGGDLYIEDNILYFSCSKMPLTATVIETGAGGCIKTLDLSYAGNGSYVLDFARTSCSAVYC